MRPALLLVALGACNAFPDRLLSSIDGPDAGTATRTARPRARWR
jgi:hypothetical protein